MNSEFRIEGKVRLTSCFDSAESPAALRRVLFFRGGPCTGKVRGRLARGVLGKKGEIWGVFIVQLNLVQMKRLLLLIGLLSATAFAQTEKRPIFNPDNVRMSITGKEFAAWLETTGDWADYNLKENYGGRDTSFTHYYRWVPTGSVNYVYFFKNGKVVAIRIEPTYEYKPEEYEAEIAKSHAFVEKKETKPGVERAVYDNPAKGYRLILITEKSDNGFKESYEVSIWCRKPNYQQK